jgi:hypothetical protein
VGGFDSAFDFVSVLCFGGFIADTQDAFRLGVRFDSGGVLSPLVIRALPLSCVSAASLPIHKASFGWRYDTRAAGLFRRLGFVPCLFLGLYLLFCAVFLAQYETS